MRESFTLYELQRIIGAAVEQFIPRSLWVSAEIADLKVNQSGHCYLELVERDEQSPSGRTAKAQARAVIWKSNYARIAAKFESATSRRLSAALKVLVEVNVTHHPVYGLSLQIVDIDPTYTIGDAERQKQITIDRLKADGVWDINRQTAIPVVVERVAVISSATAAGYRDFMEGIVSSIYNIRTTLFEAIMQGEASEESIVAALTAIAERSDEFDTVAIIRGGGSTADLECFNSYLTSLCVAQFPIPVLTGIGHDKDVSVVDMVAAVPLKTPTAVAAWLCSRAEQFDGQLEYAALMLRDCCRKASHNAELKIERYREQLRRAVEIALIRQSERLDNYALLVKNFAPQRLLRLGFAIARTEGGVVRTTADVNIGDKVIIEVADGSISAEIVDKDGKKG